MSIFEVLDNELNSISIDFEDEMNENNNEIDKIDVRYYRMRLAEINGAFAVFSSQMVYSDREMFLNHFERICNEFGTTPNKISDCFYLYDWRM